ncbi:MAG: hypothetical protein IH969_00145 [Candidatus Krumholzibacteriota bacterium]|nr:hypothetical protein [Candidatus Krumholzibacteriota bacterium]
MKIRTLIITAIVTAGCLLVQTPEQSDARVRQSRFERQKRPNAPNPDAGYFTVSARFTGLLEGTVRFGRRQVTFTKDTKFYVAGQGSVSRLPLLVGDPVYVTGKRVGHSDVARIVIVQLQR